jgi:hypothetical protein
MMTPDKHACGINTRQQDNKEKTNHSQSSYNCRQLMQLLVKEKSQK